MIAVGIDISKGKSTVAILNGDGSIRAHPYEMHHSKADLEALSRYIRAVDDRPVILMEATGHYHYPVLNAFSDLFNNINNVREDIEKRGHRIQVINKLMLRRLSKL